MNYGNLALKTETQNSDLMNIKDYIPNNADKGRRVLCLYRVSTNKQVTYNENNEADIPMQRRECRRFLEQQGWVLVHEEREDGVSGHKIRADKRDSIQSIKELAVADKFDIFLVFMFDRIGRIADETPFVVEWLSKSGISVWSTQEGEQRFDNHTDKLMNYIRFWQADGESEKTSIRTRTSLGLLVEDGHYKGGNAAYGYLLVKSGRLDKKGNEKKNLAICEDEAVIVRKIFDLYVRHGYGMHKISSTLLAEGINTRAGKKFQHSTIRHIIQNPTYTGVLRSGESHSAVIEELQIITPQMFEQAQDILKKRNTDNADQRTYPFNTESRCLLNSKIYCSDCGSRLVVSSNGKYYYENGEKMKKLRYECYGKTRQKNGCTGQSGYIFYKLDEIVDNVIRYIFNRMKSIPKEEVIKSGIAELHKEQESRYKIAQQNYTKAEADLMALKGEVLKSIKGESKFTPELLSELIAEAEKSLAEIEKIRNTLKQELESCKCQVKEMQSKYDEVISWTELYDSADMTAKKMIVANLINRIDVGAGYAVNIDFNIDLEHFDINLDDCTFTKNETA